jgi:predicted enzyme related to lactoylglutathione lyase
MDTGPGYPAWVAAVLPDLEKAVAFYTELIDWGDKEAN